MSVKWSFKIDLNDNMTWERVEKATGESMPKDLKTFIEDNNAASPDKSCITINKDERVVDSILSFNEKESEAATFKSAYKSVGKKQMIPFAIDPFGNYFCYSLKTNKIVFYHQEGSVLEETNYSLKKFVDSLY